MRSITSIVKGFCLSSILFLYLLGCGRGKNGEDNGMEGYVQTVMETGDISSAKGIQVVMHNYFVCDRGKFELILPNDCTYVGFEKQQGNTGIALKRGGKNIVLHSGARYRVKGEISERQSQERNPSSNLPDLPWHLKGTTVERKCQGPQKCLEATYFELLEPGHGEAGTTVGS